MSSRLGRKRQEKKRDWQRRRKLKSGENRGRSMRIGLEGMIGRGIQSGIVTEIGIGTGTGTGTGALKERGLVSGMEEGAGMGEEDQIGGRTIAETEGSGRGRGFVIEMGICHEIGLVEGVDPVLPSGMGIGSPQEAQFGHIN